MLHVSPPSANGVSGWLCLQDQPDSQRHHGHGNPAVQEPPGQRTGEEAAEEPRTESQGTEPENTAHHGAGPEPPLQGTALGVRQRADEGDVQVDVRIEPGQREDGGYRGQGTALAAGTTVTTGAFARRQRLRPHGAPGRHHAVRHQKCGAYIAEDDDGGRRCRHQRTCTEDSGRDQDGIRKRTHSDDGDEVFAPDALAQHERILGADGNNEGKARGQAEACGMEVVKGSHPPEVTAVPNLRPAKVSESA